MIRSALATLYFETGKRNYFFSFKPLILITLLFTSGSYAGMNSLQRAISLCEVNTTTLLLRAGADPNARDIQGLPILRWFASGQQCNDSSALATAKLLEEHGAQFQTLERNINPSLLVNLAPRGLPNTLAFLVKKKGSGDPSQALLAIAKKGDLASIRVLLEAGANPLSGIALTSALFDASTSGQGPTVLEMLKYINDKQSPKVYAAYEIAKIRKNQKVIQILLDAGIKPKESVFSQETTCQAQPLTLAQSKLLEKVGLPNSDRLSGLAGKMDCKFIQQCGDLVLIDCNSAADGPAYYIHQKTAQLLATCGGACMKGCTGCPPKEWTCKCKY